MPKGIRQRAHNVRGRGEGGGRLSGLQRKAFLKQFLLWFRARVSPHPPGTPTYCLPLRCDLSHIANSAQPQEGPPAQQTATQRKCIITLKFRGNYSVAGIGCGNLDGDKRGRIIYCTASPPSRIDRTRPSKAVCGSGVLATVGAMRTSATSAAAPAISSGRTASLNLSSRGWIAQFASGSV
jgi:hypothetical protein